MRLVDQARIDECRLAIGGASWFPFAGVFGDLSYMPHPTACVIKFPAKAGKKRDGCCRN
jgi:hypothetical protein